MFYNKPCTWYRCLKCNATGFFLQFIYASSFLSNKCMYSVTKCDYIESLYNCVHIWNIFREPITFFNRNVLDMQQMVFMSSQSYRDGLEGIPFKHMKIFKITQNINARMFCDLIWSYDRMCLAILWQWWLKTLRKMIFSNMLQIFTFKR